MTKQTMNFQAEVAQLLHLVTHSLYSNPDIFLRELMRSGIEQRAATACYELGIEPSRINVHRLIGIVNSALPDLLKMPSAPPASASSGSARYSAGSASMLAWHT